MWESLPEFLSSPTDFLATHQHFRLFVATIAMIIVISLITKICPLLFSKAPKFRRITSSNKLRNLAALNLHRWYEPLLLEHVDQPLYCNICEEIMIDGALSCEVCGYCTHQNCLSKKPVKERDSCKTASLPAQDRDKEFKHQWMRGNLPLASQCYVCKEPCGTEPALVDYRCLWCHRTAHDDCLPEDLGSFSCDFGKYRNLIVPPKAVMQKKITWKSSPWRNQVRWSINLPNDRTRTPLLVFVNPKSGGNEGPMLLRSFSSILNPIQVVDISRNSPESVLEMFYSLHQFRILSCGGDGTVGWVLSTLEKVKQNLKSDYSPPVGILPLGTGNDLARVLSWGSGYQGESLDQVLENLQNAEVIKLDRWKVEIQRPKFSFTQSKYHIMNNYFGVGVDAQICRNFHLSRNKYPFLFRSRFLNKIIYALVGGKDILEQACKDFWKHVEVELDGQKLELPELQGILILNISSWGAGVDLWGPSEPSQKLDDKTFEIVGVFSSFHTAAMFVGISNALRIGRGNHIKVRIKSPFPVEVDGEPWIQQPCTFIVSHLTQTEMLKKSSQD